MEQYPENYAGQLERLLTIVNDGKLGYRLASEKVHSPELKELFSNYSREREEMAAELREKIKIMGGRADNTEGDRAGKLHRAIMAFKTSFAKNDDQAILEACRFGDQAAVEAYDDVLQGSILETDLKPFLTGQRVKIAAAFNEVEGIYFSQFKSDPEL